MTLLKQIIKYFVFKMYPHIKYYNERISNLELAITTLANSPEYSSDENALNKQEKRKKIVQDVFMRLAPYAIVETGTHMGETTGYFSRFAQKVFTSDSSPIYMWAAKSRLSKITNIVFFIGDSRSFLSQLIRDDSLINQNVFFYLDAHWHEDLPLHEEIRIITDNWRAGSWIILIDDFCVPDDEGYLYPSYGPNKTLNYAYIKDLVEKNNLDVFFPTIHSDEETGYKTGYVFLSNGGYCSDILKNTSGIKKAS